MKIKVKIITPGCMPTITEKGDWIDLRAAETVYMNAPQAGVRKRKKSIEGEQVSTRDVKFDYKLIRLGVAMKLPKGFEAVVNPRSSTMQSHRVISANSQGVIDNSYCGNDDEWRFPAIAMEDTTIFQSHRICQFRIQPSQNATVWQKLRWLFSGKVKFEVVDDLKGNNRGGFGTSGVQ